MITSQDHDGNWIDSYSERDEQGRLESWKEIARFFKREVRTVQLWERHECLPVRRHQHRKVGTVYAYKPELVRWWKQRSREKSTLDGQTFAQSVSGLKHANLAVQSPITLSVLPFEFYVGECPDGESIQGITRQVAAQLDRFLPRRLRVTCVLAVAERHAEGAMIPAANSAAVDYSLEGSLERIAGGFQVTLRLIRVKDNVHIWTNSSDHTSSDLASTAVEIAEQVSRALFHHVLMSRHVNKANTEKSAARYPYLRGRYLWSTRTSAESIVMALEQFRNATELDPHHAPAYSGVADCYAILGWIGSIPRDFAMSQARSAALKAISLDDSLAEGHVSLGCILFDFDWDWEGAERELRLGIELNPAYAQAHCWYGHVLTALGRRKEALEAGRVAQDIDPASPVVNLFLGNALFHSGLYDDAIQQYQHVLEIQPNFALGHSGLGLAYAQAGELGSAIAHLQFAVKTSSNDTNMLSMLAYAHAMAGEDREAKALLHHVSLQGASQPAPAIDAAAAFTALKDKDSAIMYLRLGLEQRNARLTKLKSDPRLISLHSDSRFDLIAKQMRLA